MFVFTISTGFLIKLFKNINYKFPLNKVLLSRTEMYTLLKPYQRQMKVCHLHLLGIEPRTSWLKDERASF